MPRKRKGPVARGKPSTAAAAPPADVGGAIAAAGPLLATLFSVAVSAVAAFGFSRWRSPFRGPRSGKISVPEPAAFLLLIAGALALVSAAASSRRAPAFDTARICLVFTFLLPLGASRV